MSVGPIPGDDTDDDGGNITPETLGIGWITDLKAIATEGPVDWFEKRFVKFVLAFILGAFARVAGVIEGAWLWIATNIGGGTVEVWDGAAYMGTQILEFILFLLGAVETATSWAGPLAPLVWAILVALVVIAVYRIGKALLTLVNLDSVLQLLN